uniref:Metalloregulatory transcriptional repressors n=1 Tax=Magnetococcus massalia (strain MO-1) TaxID=451514 RepID=A0A1S7LJC2_MAGMO|nr:metalloregulatory transcriptional repressors [Candidatus Magnetococcus massalia]
MILARVNTMDIELIQFAEGYKALSEPLRVRLLTIMEEAGEICVHECMAITEHPQSTISRHLGALYKNGWLAKRREGVWIHYSISADLNDWKRKTLEVLFSNSSQTQWFLGDRERLRTIRPDTPTEKPSSPEIS